MTRISIAARGSLRRHLLAGVGGASAITLLGLLSEVSGSPLLFGPFGASAVLAFGASDSPLSRPRSIVGGHLIAAAAGVALTGLLGPGWWAAALGVGLAIALMLATDTLHAPAGANPVLVALGGADWSFLAMPILPGALLVVGTALVFSRLAGGRPYPSRWW